MFNMHFDGSKVKKFLGLLLVVAPVVVLAAGGQNFAGLEESANDAKITLQGMFKAILWVAALAPLGMAFFAASKMKEHIENKEEQNQHEPKWMKFTKIISAFGGGLLISFLVLGIFGRVLLGLSFAETWAKLVVNFWSGVVL